MTPAARPLILNLLLGNEARRDGGLGVQEIVAAGAVFGLAENAVRVALARAVADGLLVAPARGRYALGPGARPLADAVGRWREGAARLVDWRGDWLAVHVGAAGRSDRPALRARERAFGLLGLAEFERGLHLRPDNLDGGAESLRIRLRALLDGTAEAGTVFSLGALAASDDARARSLWDGAALSAGYRTTTGKLSNWLDRCRDLPLERAARESFALGNDAIRQLVFDPLLPAPLVDVRARSRFALTVERFDRAGRELWHRFFVALRADTPRRAASAHA